MWYGCSIDAYELKYLTQNTDLLSCGIMGNSCYM